MTAQIKKAGLNVSSRRIKIVLPQILFIFYSEQQHRLRKKVFLAAF